MTRDSEDGAAIGWDHGTGTAGNVGGCEIGVAEDDATGFSKVGIVVGREDGKVTWGDGGGCEIGVIKR